MSLITPTVILQALVSGVLMGSIYGLVGMGFSLIFGVMEVVNFAHGHLVMAGMFGSYILFQQFGVDPLLGIPLALVGGYAAGIFLYETLIRHVVAAPQFAQVVLTLALFIFLENGANFLFGGDLRGVTTGYTTAAWRVGGVAVSIARLAGAAVALAAALTPAAGFSAASVLWDAVERARTTDSKALRDAIASTNMKTGDRFYLMLHGCKFQANGDNERAGAVIEQIWEGKWHTVAPAQFAAAKPVWPKPRWRR